MKSKQLIGIVLLVAAGAVGWWGYTKSQSLGSQIGQAFNGTPPTEVLAAYGIAAVAALVGALFVARR